MNHRRAASHAAMCLLAAHAWWALREGRPGWMDEKVVGAKAGLSDRPES